MRGYDTVDYAKSRLVETIIMKDKVPVMVMQVGGSNDNILIVYNSLLDDKNNILSSPMSEFDINPVTLGYVNHKGNSHYLMRSPMRRDWRQGLRMLNIVDSEGLQPRLVSYRNIANTIMGQFPSFKSAIENVNKRETKSIAFHRDFSLRRTGELDYKGLIPVGSVDMTNGSVLINDETNWVREAFEEAMELAA